MCVHYAIFKINMDGYRQCLENLVVTNEVLERLREEFQDDIKSVRRLEMINDVRYLLEILERQDLLNVQTMERIGDIVNLRPGNMNMRIDQRLPMGAVQEESEKVQQVHKLIAGRIGRKWKEFARDLDFNENDIDNYENMFKKNSNNITMAILARFKQETIFHNDHEWLFRLRRALDYAKRNDIAERVDNLVVHFGGF